MFSVCLAPLHYADQQTVIVTVHPLDKTTGRTG